MITQEQLKELLHYNPDTGVFTWKKVVIKNQVKVGDIAGCKDSDTGYIKISIRGEKYKAHRLAFLYMTGEWPKKHIDHKNHTRHDNSWLNIRAVSRLENSRNRRLSYTNKSGVSGVTWNKRKKLWLARISVEGDRIYLKMSKDKFEVICARKAAEIKYDFHPNHGKVL